HGSSLSPCNSPPTPCPIRCSGGASPSCWRRLLTAARPTGSCSRRSGACCRPPDLPRSRRRKQPAVAPVGYLAGLVILLVPYWLGPIIVDSVFEPFAPERHAVPEDITAARPVLHPAAVPHRRAAADRA